MAISKRDGRHDVAAVTAALGLALTACGCTAAEHPTSPDGLRSPAPVRVTLSGSVYEYTFSEQRPLPGVGVHVRLIGNPPPDDMRDVVSDSNGRYLIPDALLPHSENWWVTTSVETHVQPCGPAMGDYGTRGPVVDVHTISAEAARVGGVPPTHPQSGVYGEVVTFNGGEPVSDARVELWTEDERLAMVKTDASGRFGFCLAYESAYGLRTWPFWVTVTKDGYGLTGFMSVQSAAERKMNVQLLPETAGPVR